MSDRFFGMTVALQGVAVLVGLVSAIGSGWYVWVNAPVIGGELWPYIRVVATIVGAIIGFKIGVLVVALLGLIAVGVAGVALS